VCHTSGHDYRLKAKQTIRGNLSWSILDSLSTIESALVATPALSPVSQNMTCQLESIGLMSSISRRDSILMSLENSQYIAAIIARTRRVPQFVQLQHSSPEKMESSTSMMIAASVANRVCKPVHTTPYTSIRTKALQPSAITAPTELSILTSPRA
jgi:hypothetical protein